MQIRVTMGWCATDRSLFDAISKLLGTFKGSVTDNLK